MNNFKGGSLFCKEIITKSIITDIDLLVLNYNMKDIYSDILIEMLIEKSFQYLDGIKFVELSISFVKLKD